MANTKKKKNTVLEVAINDTAKAEKVAIVPSESIITNNSALTDTGIKTLEEISKDDLLEKLQNENAELSKTNAELLEKLAEYIEKANTSTDKEAQDVSVSNIKELEDNLSTLSNELSKVISEKEILQKSIDKYLVRISELSFENAKLRANTTNTTQNNNLKSCERTIKNTMNGPIAPRNNNRFDGYEGWN